jgi:adenylate cyclase
MGSKQRFAYSTLGDAVNVAARLEGQTKYYGTNILIGEETWKAVPDLACVEADLVQVIGKTTAARIFILLGDQTMQSDPDFQDYSLKHASMIDIYRSGDFKTAQKLLKQLQKDDSYGLNALYEIYETRIKTFIKTPPKNWRGIHVADTK